MNKLKELRTKENFSFKDMGSFLSISKPYYWQLENNQRRLSYKMAFEIAKIFRLKPDDIFYEEIKKGD